MSKLRLTAILTIALVLASFATVNVPPIKRMDIEAWMWTKHKIRIRGTEPSKVRLCTAYYIERHQIDAFLDRFDEYQKEKQIT